MTVILMALLLVGVAAGCGAAGGKETSEVKLVVSSRGFAEEEVLREIYAQALEAAGFAVVRRYIGYVPIGKLEAGQVSGYPEHLDSALVEASVDREAIPAQAKAAYQEVQEQYGEDLVPLAPASLSRPKTIGITKKTAQERGIETLADLRRWAPEMTLAVSEASLSCHGSPCVSDLQDAYGIEFRRYSNIEPASQLLEALRAGQTDAAIFTATEGLVQGKKWLVLLEDDEHRLPASNAFWMTRQDVIDEAGPDYEKAILAAQKDLTPQVMGELDAKVEVEHEPAAKVAAEYLKSIGYTG